jgi:hypothetical protein
MSEENNEENNEENTGNRLIRLFNYFSERNATIE